MEFRGKLVKSRKEFPHSKVDKDLPKNLMMVNKSVNGIVYVAALDIL